MRYNAITINVYIAGYGDTLLFWTSGLCVYGNQTFIWSATGEMLTYTNWAIGEPNDYASSGDCIYIDRRVDYQWGDNHCDAYIYYGVICEQKNNY
jgi:hypothetical protein